MKTKRYGASDKDIQNYEDFKAYNFKVKEISVCDKEVFGCKRHNRDIMIFIVPELPYDKVCDIFLTQKQAIDLVAKLKEKISYNENLKYKKVKLPKNWGKVKGVDY